MASSPVLVARYTSASELEEVLRAALAMDIIYVKLSVPPPPGRHTLQLWVGSGLVGAVIAEMVGSGRSGEYPLRLRPLDPTHVPELQSLLERASAAPPPPRKQSMRAAEAVQEPAPPPPRRGGSSPDLEAVRPRLPSQPPIHEAPPIRPRAPSRPPVEEAPPAPRLTRSPRVMPSDSPPPMPRPSRSLRATPENAEKEGAAAEGAAAEDKTLASRADAPPQASASPPPVKATLEVEAPPPPVTPRPVEPEIVPGTVVFNPDAVMRDPAVGTGSEDETLPRSAGHTSSATRPVKERKSSRSYDEDVHEDGPTPTPTSSFVEQKAVSWNIRIAPTTKDPLCGRIIAAGKYVLESVIGTGAIGIVFKASHRDLGRTVAIKVLNPQFRDDPELLKVIRSEARAASLLEHPNVARVYDYGHEPDGLVYIVMEYLSGYTLGNVLGARRKLAIRRAVDIMMQVCGALSAAHDRGIVHRDVKPDNVVLVPAQDDEGEPTEIVKVCDFGIAALGTKRRDVIETPGGESYAAGTPEYMAPEQATGGPLTAAADVYACGVVLYEMLTGAVPFSCGPNEKPFQIFLKHANDPPRPPSELTPNLPNALENVVLRALSKEPEKRYASAREMRLDLRKAL